MHVFAAVGCRRITIRHERGAWSRRWGSRPTGGSGSACAHDEKPRVVVSETAVMPPSFRTSTPGCRPDRRRHAHRLPGRDISAWESGADSGTAGISGIQVTEPVEGGVRAGMNCEWDGEKDGGCDHSGQGDSAARSQRGRTRDHPAAPGSSLRGSEVGSVASSRRVRNRDSPGFVHDRPEPEVAPSNSGIARGQKVSRIATGSRSMRRCVRTRPGRQGIR